MLSHYRGRVPLHLSFLFFLLFLLLGSTISGVTLPKRNLTFSQVIASSSFTSSISVTNRGTGASNGTLYLVSGTSLWSPIINGSRITNGELDFVIQPGETRTFNITDTALKVGFALFRINDISLDQLIEGNLTYFSMSGSTLLDAVGVPESKEFLVTTIPFDSFADVGISLAHTAIFGGSGTASISATLFDENGTISGNCTFDLQVGEHYSKYLFELPWDTAVPQGFGPVGRVELLSNVAVAGISMLVTPGSAAGAQISTLPLGGTPP